MPFLFHKENTFTLIGNSPRYGVFCQTSHTNTLSRPFQFYPTPCKDFSVTIDASGKFHLLTLSTPTQLNYLCYENTHCLKKMQVVNAPENYVLSTPSIFVLQDTPYMTYLSYEHDTYNFAYQNLDGSLFTTLFTTPFEPFMLKTFVQDSIVYIFYLQHNEQYFVLKGFEVSHEEIKEINYINSYNPILDYSICIFNQEVHLTYITEIHGKYQLIYYNPAKGTATSLCTTSNTSSPVIFSYLNKLWINAYINNELCTFLSIDNGDHFSTAIPSSLQGNFLRCFFHTSDKNSFKAIECYAILSPNIKINTVYMIDFDHIHPNTFIPVELELYLEGIKLSYASAPTSPSVNNSSSPSEETPQKPANTNIQSAKDAFMHQELTGFDLAPRI